MRSEGEAAPRWRRWAEAPVDAAGLAAFRLLFGGTLLLGLCRYVAYGWIEKVFVEPDYFFKYDGFEWVQVPGPIGLYLLFGFTAVCALGVALGAFYRLSAAGFLLGFLYVQLMDVSTYLNHYYLVVLLAGLALVLPLDRVGSVDAWRRRRRGREAPPTVPRWTYELLRLQLTVVYFYAALAKAHPDWLLHAQPLGIWMRARVETPLVGALLDEIWLPWVMAWAGFLYDLTIWIWLRWRRSRALAYLAVLVFHAFTHLFFDIGMFPLIMVGATTIFFEPDWPRRLVRRLRRASAPALEPSAPTRAHALSRPAAAAIALYVAFQILFPLRHLAYPGDVLWNEQGMRYAWKVMVREKNGSLTYHVRDPASGRSWQVNPSEHLVLRQMSDMSSQPDLIAQLGQHIGWTLRRQGLGEVEVRAEAWVSLNGRPPALLLDPSVDLMQVDRGWRPQPWVTDMPDSPPLPIRPLVRADLARR